MENFSQQRAASSRARFNWENNSMKFLAFLAAVGLVVTLIQFPVSGENDNIHVSPCNPEIRKCS